MQLASSGLRATTRNASNFIPRSRGLHLSSVARAKPTSTTQRLIHQTRTLLGQLFAQLTAPGLQARGSYVPSVARSLHGGLPGRPASIQQRFSLPVRTALAGPMKARYFPRGPAMPAFGPTNVGLGTARNFSSGKVLFQNIAENVPIATRALFEAGWDVKGCQDRKKIRRGIHERKRANTGEKMKPKHKGILVDISENESSFNPEKQLDQYFQTQQPQVTTRLLIPLAPAPDYSSIHPDDPNSLLPIPQIVHINREHELHSLRVSTLFSRLDTANVWERGVECTGYATRADISGVCNILQVEFVGWTRAEVRSVIGESGTGWCSLEETLRPANYDEVDPGYLSDETQFSVSSGISSDIFQDVHNIHQGVNESSVPSDSFVLPTLDFSSSFLRTASESSLNDISPLSNDLAPSSDTASSWSELSSECGESFTGSWIEPPSTNGWFGNISFSSDFTRRADEAETQPREYLF